MATKKTPAGLGFYLAFEKAVDPGDKSRDLQVTIDRCLAAGATWIAPRAGAGGANDAAFDEKSVAAYIAAGLLVYPWIFPYPGREATVVSGFKRYFVAGAHGCIINAEFEYQPASAASARAMVAAIRTAWAEAQAERLQRGLEVTADECFIAHAPPDYLGAGIGHPLSDELVALDEVCDAIMPQTYAWEHDDRGHDFHVNRVMAGYAKRGLYADKVWPVGCTYRPKQRGGKPTPAMDGEAARVGSDVIAFLDNAYVKACPAPSLYSLDAISWINGAADQVMAKLVARRASSEEPDTIPDSPTGKSSQSMRAVHVPTETPQAVDFVRTLADPEEPST